MSVWALLMYRKLLWRANYPLFPSGHTKIGYHKRKKKKTADGIIIVTSDQESDRLALYLTSNFCIRYKKNLSDT